MSGAIYILDELLTTMAAPTPEQDQALINLGVPADITYYVGTAKVRPNGNTYEPDPNGMSAWIIPCMDQGETCDLLAFTSNEPGRWWLRLGVAAYLGGDALGDVVMDEPVRVLREPLSWLRVGAPANGLVILDWDIARRQLEGVDLVAADIEFGRELDKRLTIPAQRPRVHVPRRAA